tara:strand:- start:205 stop:561 length:357 start_codon:yes stop_codon:yes gene_type:complete
MKLKAIICLVAIGILSGCTTVSDAGYYWGNYSNTYYNYTKDPSDKTLAAHIAELQNIVAKSDEMELKVPPGLYAELGYISERQGEPSKSASYYQKEMELYPESKTFLERLTSAGKENN